ncbi:MAG: PAS domain S-box protein, partial [Proteobacteria bacterium]|nr:PAS domain S-box protein [Pseudomonadota bacterium]
MKKELHKKQNQLNIIFNSVPAMIWSKNAEGKYLQVNRAYCETVGLSEEKIIG